MAAAVYAVLDFDANSIASCPGTAKRNCSYIFDPSRSNSGSEIVRLSARPHSASSSKSNSPSKEAPQAIGPPLTSSVSNPEYNPRNGSSEWLQDDCVFIIVGRTKKPFSINTRLLTAQSNYFRRVVATLPDKGFHKSLCFPDFDEFAFTLFAKWLCGEKLPRPYDFHTLQHPLGLYCLSRIFEIEALSNQAMDIVRRYYREEDMTAPPFRLAYIFKNTIGPCPMRNFLTATAAFRVLRAGHLSQVMTDLVESGGELASCLMEMILRLSQENLWDPRTGPDCIWHEHKESRRCQTAERNSEEEDNLQNLEDFSRMTVDGNGG